MCSSLWSETETVFQELSLEDWRKFLRNCLLNHSVNNSWNSKLSKLAFCFFGYFYPANWVIPIVILGIVAGCDTDTHITFQVTHCKRKGGRGHKLPVNISLTALEGQHPGCLPGKLPRLITAVIGNRQARHPFQPLCVGRDTQSRLPYRLCI